MKSPRQTIQVRAHTALCMQGFVGKGYSPSFVAEMHRVVDLLQSKADIELIAAPDQLCGACPHGETNQCRLHERDNEAHIVAQDQAVLRTLKLQPNSTLSWQALVELVRQNIGPKDLDNLCGDCPWLPMGMCREALAKIRETNPDQDNRPVEIDK